VDHRCLFGLIAAATALLAVLGPAAHARCADHDPLKRAYFGDLHVHTAFSYDAYRFGTRPEPDGAYASAVARDLDFAAATDHAEMLGETYICTIPGTPGYDEEFCVVYRSGVDHEPADQLCRGDEAPLDPEACQAASDTVWARSWAHTEAANDPCTFTAFHGYEYTRQDTGVGDDSARHRNVVFRSDIVPSQVVSATDVPNLLNFWNRLKADCVSGDGCDVITIPHGSNLSDGQMFVAEDAKGVTFDTALLSERATMEPVVEIIQHQGSSECQPELSPSDEECGFELIEESYTDLEPGSYVREALKIGLAVERETGVNPFRYGLVGGSDTHNATPGATDEATYEGNQANNDVNDLLSDRNITFNPGGLVGVWAPENTRDAIFDALVRREVFATSGTRLRVRFYAGWTQGTQVQADQICALGNVIERAEGWPNGVPMGGVLPVNPGTGAPLVVVLVAHDPATGPLQEIQLVKGLVDGETGETSEEVVSLAWSDVGAATMCAAWRDESFDPGAGVFYYTRAFALPSLRWHASRCQAAGASCGETPVLPEGFETCCDVPWTIRERAWSSPIWYHPAD